MTNTNFLVSDEFSDEKTDMQEAQSDNLTDDLDLEEGAYEDADYARKKDNEQKAAADNIVISKSKAILINKLLKNIQETNEKIIMLLSGTLASEEEARISIGQISEIAEASGADENKAKGQNGRIIEGVFDGENMIGPDGKQYSVPANYASKSKLIEGDMLKLTITPTGTFVYKQIAPIERIRIVGVLEQGENGNFTVVSGSKRWKVLTASVTYYKGQDGDEVVILVPKAGESAWAAVENIVRKAY